MLLPPRTWYLIDTLGFMTGILYAEYDNKLSSINSNSSFKMIIVSVLVFLIFTGAGIAMNGMTLGRYMKLITIGYSLFACAIVAMVGRLQLRELRICKLLGALSFFVYLTHVKIANTLYAIGVSNVAIAFFAVLLCSTVMYLLYTHLFSSLEIKKS